MATTKHISETIGNFKTLEECQVFKKMLEQKAEDEGLSVTEWNNLIEVTWAKGGGSAIKSP